MVTGDPDFDGVKAFGVIGPHRRKNNKEPVSVRIIISEDTLNGIEDKKDLHFRFLGLVKVKGKTKPLKIYEVLDGVTDQINKLKIETREIFESGLKHYFERDFINAAAKFKSVTTTNKSDVSAQMYLKLSAKFMVEIVPENWTGVETMLLK